MLHHMAGIVQAAPKVVLFEAVVGSDTNISPTVQNATYAITDYDWYFGGGSPDQLATDGVPGPNLPITGAPVTIRVEVPDYRSHRILMGLDAVTAFTIPAANTFTERLQINNNNINSQTNLSLPAVMPNLTVLTTAVNNMDGTLDISETRFPVLQICQINNNAHTGTLTIPTNTNFVQLEASFCDFDRLVNVANAPNINSFQVRANAIPSADLSQMLTDLVAGGVTNGLLRYDGQTGNTHLDVNVANGAADRATLVGRGWTVNGAY